MIGVGVGFDTKGEDKFKVFSQLKEKKLHVVDDSREGWVESVRILLESYLKPG